MTAHFPQNVSSIPDNDKSASSASSASSAASQTITLHNFNGIWSVKPDEDSYSNTSPHLPTPLVIYAFTFSAYLLYFVALFICLRYVTHPTSILRLIAWSFGVIVLECQWSQMFRAFNLERRKMFD